MPVKNDFSEKFNACDNKLIEIVKKLTRLEKEDIRTLLEVSHTLPYISALEDGDAYIDILTEENNLAVVVAQHRNPKWDFYKRDIVGEIMWRSNEPAVYRALETGVTSRGLRAIIAKGKLAIRQNVSAITNTGGEVIGCIIVERDFEDKDCVELYSDIKQFDAELYSGIELQNIGEYTNDAIIVFDMQGICTYANSKASLLFPHIDNSLAGFTFDDMGCSDKAFSELIKTAKTEYSEVKLKGHNYIITYNKICESEELQGIALVVKDITDLREKENELAIKSVVVNEIHHRVKNNLQMIISLIGLRANQSESREVKEFSNEITNRIRNITVTHDVLAQTSIDDAGLKVTLDRVMKNFKTYILSDELDLQIDVKGDEIYLKPDSMTVVIMIVAELMQNCIKHAFSNVKTGHITALIKKGDPFSTIRIRDDGVGFNDTVKDVTGSSMGLKLVNSLIKDKLHGTLNIIHLDVGTEIVFTFVND